MERLLNYLPLLGLVLFVIGALGFMLDTWVTTQHMPLPLLYDGWKYVLISVTGLTILMISLIIEKRSDKQMQLDFGE